MARRRYFTDDQIEAALRATAGVQRVAATHLAETHGRPCSRSQINDRIKRSERLQRALEEILESNLDVAEGKLLKAIGDGNLKAVIFYLSTRGKGRGYTHRLEQTGPGGAPIRHDVSQATIRDMTPEEADAYLAARSVAPQG